MNARRVVVEHPTCTDPQADFFASPARYRLYMGGVGAGKTRAGCLEVLRMPGRSRGMVIAPTYPMLRDATLHTFLRLVRHTKTLDDFNKGEMAVTLVDGKQVLFRSADEPDRLRGPNLGWFWLDEAAMMDEDTWLIMLGRLREQPGRAWLTTTPRGFNWLYDTFGKATSDDYQTIKASSRSNPYLPAEFVPALEQAYTGQWQRQEIDGEWVEQAGPIFKRAWFGRVVPTAPEGLRWVRYYDLAASQRETASRTATIAGALDESDGTLYLRDGHAAHMEWPDQERMIARYMLRERDTVHGVEKALHGIAAVQSLMRDPVLAGIALVSVDVHRDKVTRALPWAARAEQGKVVLIDGAWIPDFLDEVVAFDGSSKTRSDYPDSVSGCVDMLGKYGGEPVCVVASSGRLRKASEWRRARR